ncbi:MAG: histidine kinase [Saprospiraceae bacterium]|nr:histidine kinase [Saprospiraceae bacterium]
MEGVNAKITRLLGNRWASHTLFWLGVLLSYPILSFAMEQSFAGAVIIKLFYLPTQMIAAYFLVYFQLPKLLYPGKVLAFFLSLIVSFYVLGTLTHGVIDHLLVPNFAPEAERTSWQKIFFGFEQVDAFYVIWVYWAPVTMASLKLIKQSLERKTAIQQLEKEKIQVELDNLQSQLHPRFLSNTLKTIHRLSLEQSDAAPELIASLSEMLDYMLYQTQAKQVSVAQEVEILQTFFEIESLRQNGNMKLHLEWPSQVNGVQIKPLLLFSLVENALVQEDRSKQEDFEFNYRMTYQDQRLTVAIDSTQVRSNYAEEPSALRQQLNWFYPDRYELIWNAEPHQLHANLNLQL